MKKQTLFLLILCILSFVGHLFIFPMMPDVVPSHWDLNGEINGYSNKLSTIFIALLPLFMLLLFHFIPRIDPRGENYKKHQKAYDVFCTIMVLFLIVALWISNAAIFGYDIHMEQFVPIGVGIILLVSGNYMPQIRINYTLGIKTPWTLDNEWVWKKTHEMAGIVFCVTGILMILCGFLHTSWMSKVSFAGILLGVAWLELYSYLMFRKWKREHPDR
ncbi:MAG: DUF1648 domain-containing protein [Lachnospiraceae bacterium]|nr:DUF1648 domain-containing protein [Lachnospiraceae bacterium]